MTPRPLDTTLDASPLADHERVTLDAFGEPIIALHITPKDAGTTLEQARALSPDHHPILTVCWTAKRTTPWADNVRQANLFSRWGTGDRTPRELIRAADTFDLHAWLNPLLADGDPCPDGDDATTWPSHDPTLFDTTGETLALLLLPIPRPADALAYLTFFGVEVNPPAEAHIALLRRWEDQYGATLLRHFGTMLEFTVARPPTSLDDAQRLANQHVAIAPCTTLLPGISIPGHARTLLNSRDWHLHERP